MAKRRRWWVVDKARFYEGAGDGAKRSAPAALRNREPIAAELREWLPSSGLVLEIASGTGEHAAYFAKAFPNLAWQPSDVDPFALASIAAWGEDSELPNLHRPVVLDAALADWPADAADAVISINMVHISPWASALGLVAGAAGILPPDGALILYGPWLKDDIATAPSNREFDGDLKRRNPEWGLRRVEDFAAAAGARGLSLEDVRTMPANNLMLLFRKGAEPI